MVPCTEASPGRLRVTVGARPPLPALFRLLYALQRRQGSPVVDYAVSQPSLEALFLRLARLQAGPVE